MDRNPVGFHPTDSDKIMYLVLRATSRGSLVMSEDDFIEIPTVDVYGDQSPWQIFPSDIRDGEEFHFFSKLKITGFKQMGNSDEFRLVRPVGVGTWERIEGGNRVVFNHDKIQVGSMNGFAYIDEHTPAQNKHWVLEEYSLAGGRFRDWVPRSHTRTRFCTIRYIEDGMQIDDVPSTSGQQGPDP